MTILDITPVSKQECFILCLGFDTSLNTPTRQSRASQILHHRSHGEKKQGGTITCSCGAHRDLWLWFSGYGCLRISSKPLGTHIWWIELSLLRTWQSSCFYTENGLFSLNHLLSCPKRSCLISSGKSLSIFICESRKSFGVFIRVFGLERLRVLYIWMCVLWVWTIKYEHCSKSVLFYFLWHLFSIWLLAQVLSVELIFLFLHKAELFQQVWDVGRGVHNPSLLAWQP